MKCILYCIVIIVYPSLLFAQIRNADFEKGIDKTTGSPLNWNAAKNSNLQIDSGTAFSGRFSLQLQNNADSLNNRTNYFFQNIDLRLSKAEKIAITAYIKTKSLNGSVRLQCNLLNSSGKFVAVRVSTDLLADTREWTQVSLELIADSSIKQLMLCGVLQGKGIAWFDSFKIKKITPTNKSTSPQVEKYLTETIKIAQRNSIVTDSINWQKLKEQMHQLSKLVTNIDSIDLLTGFILYKLRGAGDYHSFFMRPKGAHDLSIKNTSTGQPVSKLLAGNIGYIKVPGFGSINDTACLNFAQKIQSMIQHLDSQYIIKGWIVDLRNNSGGNMYPMIAGLGPLIGDGIAGYFISPKEKSANTFWYYRNGRSGSKEIASVIIEHPYILKKGDIKIAVLIGSHTASSGEATTISFIGKSNVKLIGEDTGGFTTSNTLFNLPDGSFFFLATNYETDRNKKKYIGSIHPDILIKENRANNGDDDILQGAQAWINN